MGKAARWLRGLFGGKGSGSGEPPPEKDKRRWGFAKSFREKEKEKGRNPTPPPMRSYRAAAESDSAAGVGVGFRDEQNKRAIAVAAATAAVAEAAVAAAHAAAAVVRLTSSGRGAVGFGAGRREEWAAVKIQAAFRGYLARRALRALKGLVKLQALVRGNIVRKQAAETLRCMHALLRVQARTRACRALRSEKTRPDTSSRSHPGPPTHEKFESAIRATATKSAKRNPSKPSSTSAAVSERTTQSSGWNWLDRWMEERYWDSREATPTKSRNGSAMDDEKNAKILEIDTGKPQPNPKRRSNHHHSSCSTLTSDNHSRSFAAMHDSPSKDSTAAHQSIPSPSSVEMQQSPIPLRFPAVEVCEFESPQFYSASSRPGSSRRGPFTPSKSECSRSLFSGFSDYPNYMANTQSSKAKVRSHSAPRQRPEFDKSGSMKRLFGHQQHSAPSAQRSSSMKSGSKAYPGSGRLDRLGMPIRITSGF